MDPTRRVLVAAGPDTVRQYTTDEEERLAKNLYEITKRVHEGEFSGTPLDDHLIGSFHQALFKGVRDHAGRARNADFGADYLSFGPNRSVHKDGVPGELDGVFQKLSSSVRSFEASPEDSSYEPSAVRVAVWAHAEVIRIHPFEDGNGRTSRLLLDAILVRLGLRPLPLEVPKEEYRAALNFYYGSGDIQPLVDLALRVYRSLYLRTSPWL